MHNSSSIYLMLKVIQSFWNCHFALLILSLFIRTSFPSPLQLSDFPLPTLLSNLSIISFPLHRFALRCANPCGWADQLCCAADQHCYTDELNQAQCGAGAIARPTPPPAPIPPIPHPIASEGYWSTWTSTWVETNFVTRVEIFSTFVIPKNHDTPPTVALPPPPPPSIAPIPVPVPMPVPLPHPVPTPPSDPGSLTCNYDQKESNCGSICCDAGMYCFKPGDCRTVNTVIIQTFITGSNPSFTIPLSPTSILDPRIVFPSDSRSLDPSSWNASPSLGAGTDSSLEGRFHRRLTKGAIAGIVIGSLLGAALLISLCVICSIRGLWNSLSAAFGGRRPTNSDVTYTSTKTDTYTHSDPYYSHTEPPKSRFGKLGFITAGLAAIALALGIKKRYNRHQAKSNFTGSSGSYTAEYRSHSSPSSPSSPTDHYSRSRTRTLPRPRSPSPSRSASRTSYLSHTPTSSSSPSSRHRSPRRSSHPRR